MSLAVASFSALRKATTEHLWPFIIDWAHQEAVGLVDFAMATPAGMVDLVSGAVATRTGDADPSQINEFGGLDAFFDGDGDQYSFPNNAAFDTTQDFTIVWEVALSSFTDSVASLFTFFSSSGFAARLAYSAGTGSDLFMTDGANLLQRLALPSGVAITDRHFGVWSYRSSVGHSVWINGGTCTDNGSVSPANTTNSRRVGGSSANSQDFNGGIRQVRRYTRAWSEEEAIAFSSPQTRDAILIGFSSRSVLSGCYLSVSEGYHSHSAEQFVLSTGKSLVVADAEHSHAADGLVLVTDLWLSDLDGTHSHAAESLTLNTHSLIEIDGAWHTHLTGSPEVLAQISTPLEIANSAQQHLCDVCTWSFVESTPIADGMAEAMYSHSVEDGVAVECSRLHNTFRGFLDTADAQFFDHAQATTHTLRYRAGQPMHVHDWLLCGDSAYVVRDTPRRINRAELVADLVKQ